MKLTKRKLSILTLAVVLLMSLACLFGLNAFKLRTADASGTVTVSGTNVFTASNGAKVAGGAVGEGDGAKYYSTMTFTANDNTVSYRRNLAYNWFEEVTVGEGEEAEKKVVNGQFNMEIGFKNTSFDKFVITFESQQYNKTKDAKTKNYIAFFPASEGKVYALITDKEDVTAGDLGEDKTELDAGYIYIKFDGKYTEDYTGGYNVFVSDEGGAITKGKFKNVGGNYAKYSSSSTTPVYPLIFNTDFGDRETKNAEMTLYAINGQSFETTSSTANTVSDNKAPVLCLEEEFTHFKLNGALDIDYVVIDVLRNSPPTPAICYYVLSDKQYGDAELKDYADKSLFKETKTASDVNLVADKNKYLPSVNDLKGTAFDPAYIVDDGKLVPNTEDEKPLADMLIKVYFKLVDTSSNSETAEVFLDWYVNDEFLVTMDKSGNESKFLAVAEDKRGVTFNYNGIESDDTESDAAVKEWGDTKTAGTILGDYQAQVTKLANNLSAGSSSYMYLPSPESLFSDNSTAYTDLTFSIYYYHDSKQSNTNLSSSNLSINITKQGKYMFTVYATDAANNSMYYIDKDGELKEFKSSDIWTMFDDDDKDVRDKLPWFEFTVGYKGVEFEKTPGMQTTAYVGTQYTSAKFDINGISGNYTTNYRLYLFDSAKYYNENDKATFTYEEFIDKMDELFENPLTHVYFEEILQVSESDPDYEKYKDYGWNNSSTSFTPQDANAFYYIRAEVKDKGILTDPVTCSLAIVASETAETIKGESDWLANNVASVVLLVIAVVALVGIVLLLVIKPKDKGDVDVQLEKAQKKSKKN